MNAAVPDLGGKQWTKAVPPVPYGFMANVYALSMAEQKGTTSAV